jgi:tetratricopeptide (TPR) repeat protein
MVAFFFARQGRLARLHEGSSRAHPTRAHRVVHAARALGYGLLLLAWMFVAPFYRALTWRPRTRTRRPDRQVAAHEQLAATETPPTLHRAPSAGPPPGGSHRVTLPDVECVEVGAKFSEPHYAQLFALLQLGPLAKLLDLRAATVIQLDLFERLAAAWTARPGTVGRLGILLGYESWVVFRNVAARRLRPIVDRGVELEIFYEQQADSLPAWFADGRVHHDQLVEVIEWLRTQWRPTAIWPTVLSATAMLVQASAAVDQGAELLLELAAIALSFEGADGAEQAAKHASAAVLWVGDRPSRARCRALRALATATFRAGESEAGLAHMEAALTAAMVIQDPIEEASALADLGFHALRRGHAARAEVRFRSAIALLSADGSAYLLAALHHSLADALYQQDKQDGAEHHAQAALSLRWDPESSLAARDRVLLARIRARRNPAISSEDSR